MGLRQTFRMKDMTDSKFAAIAEAATRFRAAIGKCGPALDFSFRQFPRGTCGDVAPLLGTFLSEQGFGTFEYVLGERGEQRADANTYQSHAWIQQGPLIVDITADQFPEIDQKVIVTQTSDWHRTFNTKILHNADYRIFDGWAKERLHAIYQSILAAMPSL